MKPKLPNYPFTKLLWLALLASAFLRIQLRQLADQLLFLVREGAAEAV
jgi:hypothetical protein